MNPDNTFLGAYLKVDRANHHIQSLIDNSQPLAPSMYELGWRPRSSGVALAQFGTSVPDPNKPVRELAYVPKQPVSNMLALIIGDAVHNLRAALDYAATAVVRAKNGDTQFVSFPFHEKRENLIETASPLNLIKAALSDADVQTFFRDTIKPYSDGNAELWTLTKIDKIDKHNFILPTVTIADVRHNGVVAIDGVTIGFNQIRGDANREHILYRMPVREGDAGKYNVDVAVEILFPQGKFFSGLPVIPTLTKLSQIVEQTLLAFEEFAVANGCPVGVKRS